MTCPPLSSQERQENRSRSPEHDRSLLEKCSLDKLDTEKQIDETEPDDEGGSRCHVEQFEQPMDDDDDDDDDDAQDLLSTLSVDVQVTSYGSLGEQPMEPVVLPGRSTDETWRVYTTQTTVEFVLEQQQQRLQCPRGPRAYPSETSLTIQTLYPREIEELLVSEQS